MSSVNSTSEGWLARSSLSSATPDFSSGGLRSGRGSAEALVARHTAAAMTNTTRCIAVSLVIFFLRTLPASGAFRHGVGLGRRSPRNASGIFVEGARRQSIGHSRECPLDVALPPSPHPHRASRARRGGQAHGLHDHRQFLRREGSVPPLP